MPRKTTVALNMLKNGDERINAECDIGELKSWLAELKAQGATVDGWSRVTITVDAGDISQQARAFLGKQLAAKKSLLKLAFNSRPPKPWKSEVEERELRFVNIAGTLDEGEIRAYTEFAAMLCDQAVKLKKASDKEKPIINPKYSMRVWLLRLGMIGDGYKLQRSALLRHLEGNSAFLRESAKEIEN